MTTTIVASLQVPKQPPEAFKEFEAVGPTLRAEKLKAQISVEDVLRYYGSTEKNKKWRCLFPSQHTGGDSRYNVSVHHGRAHCRGHECFGERGADIFEIVGLSEPRLRTFEAQKSWIIETFTVTKTGYSQ